MDNVAEKRRFKLLKSSVGSSQFFLNISTIAIVILILYNS